MLVAERTGVLPGYIAYDPQEDTETRRDGHGHAELLGYIAYDPQEDTETSERAVLGFVLLELHRLRSARGY